MIRKTLLSVALLAALSACAVPTPYQPAANGGYGYSEQRIENNRYRLSFSGNSATDRRTVEDYLLYRAAELTVRLGGDYFVLVKQDIEPKTRYPATTGGFGYRTGWGYSHNSIFMGTGTERPITEYTAYADIVIYRGQKPADDPNAYDANEVGSRLAPTIVRPAPAGTG